MGKWDSLESAPPDAILGITTAFKADDDVNKLNLGVGAYRTAEGLPFVLPSVREAEERVVAEKLNKEYLPIEGHSAFCRLSAKLIIGDEDAHAKERIATVQALSGTGALKVAAEMLHLHSSNKDIYISRPTWGNHRHIFTSSGLTVKEYRYYDKANNNLDFEGFLEDIRGMREESTIVLHACAHNPTGMDPTHEQWSLILQAIKQQNVQVIFDCAYQGYASGDLDTDRYAIDLFLQHGLEVWVCQSFSKNMGLYGERVGALHMVAGSPSVAQALKSQAKVIIRGLYSNPPTHGARVAACVLGDPDLMSRWKSDVRAMAGRILGLRQVLKDALIEAKAPGSWDHITTQIGMFAYTGLNEQQSRLLTTKHHVYLTKDGRISMAGLNDKSAKRLACAIADVLTEIPTQ